MTALLDVDQLRTFIAIAETGSFTRAADIVHKTQSAVSMQMKRLEERLDRSIFARDGRASKLTEDGERLLDYARRIVKLNVETIAAFSDELTGRVRLGVPDDYADRYLPEIMARFSRAYPAIELTVICEETICLLERIKANELDLAIITNCSGSMTAENFRQERLLWATSNRHSTHIEERLPLALGRPTCALAPRRDRVPRERSGGPIACSIRAAMRARSAPRCCPGLRCRCFRNRDCGPACACSRRRTDSPSCRPAASGWCAIRTSAIRSPMRSPSTSSRRSTTCRRRRARRSSFRVMRPRNGVEARHPPVRESRRWLRGSSPRMTIRSAAVASSTRTRSAGASSICSPRRPPFTMMLACASALCAMNTRTRFFCPNGEMPPT